MPSSHPPAGAGEPAHNSGYPPLLPESRAQPHDDAYHSDDSDLDPSKYRYEGAPATISRDPDGAFDVPVAFDEPRPSSYFDNLRSSHDAPQHPQEFSGSQDPSYFRAMSPTRDRPAARAAGDDGVELNDLGAKSYATPTGNYPVPPSYDSAAPGKGRKSMESVSSRLARKLSGRSKASTRHVEEGLNPQELRRQRSLVRPERARPPDKRDPHYHSALRGNVITAPAGPSSSVGNKRTVLAADTGMRRGRSLARRSTVKERVIKEDVKRRCPSVWVLFSKCSTFYAPPYFLRCCGISDPDIQQAWREKMALVTIIVLIMGCVGFLTFGFQQVVCGLSTATQNYINYASLENTDVIINGRVYDVSKYSHPGNEMIGQDQYPGNLIQAPAYAGGMDISYMFQLPNNNCKGFFNIPSPANDKGDVINFFPCILNNGSVAADPGLAADNVACHTTAASRTALSKLRKRGDQFYDWDTISGKFADRQLLIYSGSIIDMDRLQWLVNGIVPVAILNELASPQYRGRDVSYFVGNNNPRLGRCLQEMFRVAALDTNTIGCIASELVLYVSLIVILAVVLTKFGLALVFGWVIGPRLGQLKDESPEERRRRIEAIEQWSDVNNHYGQPMAIRPQYSVAAAPKRSRFFPTTSRFSTYMPGEEPGRARTGNYPSVYNQDATARQSVYNQSAAQASSSSHSLALAAPGARQRSQATGVDEGIVAGTYSGSQDGDLNNPKDEQLSPAAEFRSDKSLRPGEPPMEMPNPEDLAYTILLVTCYSEGAHGIRTTLDSLAGTVFPTSHKCLFIICDGIITGAGESVSTPDVCLAMMKDFIITPDHVQPYSYVSIADGTKRHNMAKIYAGYYSPDENSPAEAKRHRVPMVLIVKCGTPAESEERKPGNRGKRDSQIILMSFLQHVMFDERMTELEYELFNAMWNVTGVTPDNFEIVLMVDADTKVYPDSVSSMVATMVRDPQIMGLCGETKIANKSDSWVSMIQVFEYYISHHQSKAFESIFGGVTCLPGCFCMYRIKAPKGAHGYWVPILANPDIVENYSENVVDTLHKKNLLLLGEDRYLSTLMLRTFPKRKMVFVPTAVCKTIVPDEFKVLLSQRRRWINSTVHNLLELVLVRDLCGTFFFSMQFVIFMELVGTVVLPAAISFTLYLVIISTFTRPVPIIPLMLLAAILGLPAILITLTTRKIVYVGWMLIYLMSLPVWNFVLPVYAFWHFDDFSWGETRKVTGEGKDTSHGDKEGEFDSSKIVMKRWCEFEAEKRRRTTMLIHNNSGSLQYPEVPALPEGMSPSSAGGGSTATPPAPAFMANGSPASGATNASLDKLGYMTPQYMNRLSVAPSAQASVLNLNFTANGSPARDLPAMPSASHEIMAAGASGTGYYAGSSSEDGSRSSADQLGKKASEEPMLSGFPYHSPSGAAGSSAQGAGMYGYDDDDLHPTTLDPRHNQRPGNRTPPGMI
ncbi:hypothetical protein IWQ60_010434 [Tieghemiomyces parasiticus]|uniref:chitin synthase n=1 Tax=Tieghemiomyces parasiticus TaxID=78921 RepID=A0A9W7ZUI7_9FUNG|nr:hypothetical protein IWQ60_010434 [Tieghemiomyces parasiticus]